MLSSQLVGDQSRLISWVSKKLSTATWVKKWQWYAKTFASKQLALVRDQMFGYKYAKERTETGKNLLKQLIYFQQTLLHAVIYIEMK